MKKLITAPGLAMLVVGLLGFFMAPAPAALADSIGPITFESPTYVTGSISGQDGWSNAVNPTYDQAVVTNTYGYSSFASQSFRISDAVTSGSFGDWVFAKPLTDSAGETAATSGTFSAGTKQSHFEMQFDIASTLQTPQPGLHISVAPDRGDGSRMSYLRFEDQADGIHVFFDDVTDAGPVGTVATFNDIDVGTISRSVPHTIKLTMDFVDGPANDIVKTYIDGSLVHTGTSWEDYYRYDPEASAEQSPRIVKTVIIQARGTATTADLGNGFLFDNLSLTSGPIAANVVTNAATSVVSNDATLNGTNGPAAATGHSFWVSLAPFSTASPTIPANVYSTPDFGAIAANTAFSASLSSITTTGVPSNLPAITANTPYYFAAWSLVGGTWYPGAVLNFNTQAAANVTTNPATGVAAMSATVNGTNGPSAADNTSFWLGTTPGGPFTPAADPTSELPSGWSGVGSGSQLANAVFSYGYTGLVANTTYNFVAWSYVGGIWYPGAVLSFSTPATVNQITVTQPATVITPTSATVNGTNGAFNADDTSFWLGTTSSGAFTPAADPTSELPTGWSGVDSLTQIANAPFSYGYTGLIPNTQYYFAAWSYVGGIWYPGAILSFNTSNTGSITVEKDTIGGNGTFTFASNITGNTNFTITTVNNAGSQTFANLAPGTYQVTENAAKGWTMMDNECASVTIKAGDSPTCIISNTNNKLLGEIRGTKYEDRDGDGTLKDGDHHRLVGWTINLASGSTIIASTVTDKHGNYRFSSLPAGNYTVSEVSLSQPGWVQTYPKSLSYSIALAAGKISKNDNFGNFKLGTISGMKFNDANANGRKDINNEPGLAGWVIDLTKVGSPTVIAKATTVAGGAYSFANVGPGTYQVREEAKTGWHQTTKNPNDIKLFSGEVSKNNNFGNNNGTIVADCHRGIFGNWGFGKWQKQCGGAVD